MSEKEYAVIVKRGVNLTEVEDDLKASTGSGPIPNRSVDVANARPGSTRITHFALTDEEASALQADDRIEAVEIPPDQRDDIQIGLRSVQDGTFYRGSGLNSAYANWGLRRCIAETNVFTGTSAPDSSYPYAVDGTGIDIVIQDSGIQVGHPEWLDKDGVTRLQSIDWYTASGLAGTQNANHDRDWDGHGTHVASTAAGLRYGWAKNARIYSQKLSGLEFDGPTGIPIADAFDSIRLWHNAKPVDPATGYKRPTVVNMSWGYFASFSGNPTSGVYRGTPWTWGVEYNSDFPLWAAVGVVPPTANGGTTRILPGNNAFTDAEVDDMIDAGIHICIAAGNNYYKADISGGDDYDNTVTAGGQTFNYHRGSSPKNTRAFMVGNVDTSVAAGNIDELAESSTKGPLVNIHAPGTSIFAACSTTNDGYSTIASPDDANYRVMSISGTSMASPQVAGVCALHLQVQPWLTPAQLQAKLFAESKSVLYSSGTNNDYDNQNDLMGAPNRMLFSKYGRQPSTTSGAITFTNLPPGGAV